MCAMGGTITGFWDGPPRGAEIEEMNERESVSGQSGAPATQIQDVPAKVDRLPPFRVLLHNDPVSDFDHVIDTLVDLTPLDPAKAEAVTMEAHESGVALVLVTHRERAELYVDQFKSKLLTVTIEPEA